jgi:Xaa-Pro aminopeptidase
VDSSFFKNNRKRLRERVGIDGPIVIAGNGLMQRNSDNTFPFRQDSYFFYLTGISEPDLTLVINKTNEFLIVPVRNSSREAFDGALDSIKLTKLSGIAEIVDSRDGSKRLKADLTHNKLATLGVDSSYNKGHGFYLNPARARLMSSLKRKFPGVEITDLRPILASMRVIKQPVELEQINKAIDITLGALDEINRNLQGFNFEWEIELELDRLFKIAGADGHSFHPIIAGGKNACTLHNMSNHSKLISGELLVADVGAEVNNYAADITRTYILSTPSTRQKQVIDAVLEVQQFALKRLIPGTSFKEYELAVERFMGQKLVELKLISSVDNRADIRKYFPHATSHFMGLDVHDVGDYREPMAEDMVVTCEPGIYIPEEGIGVRIEDDILITKTGNRVLSSSRAVSA